jgi:hypothetical protein
LKTTGTVTKSMPHVAHRRLWLAFIHPICRHFRISRASKIRSLLPNFEQSNVCDIGGSRHYWEKVNGILKPNKLTILNIADDSQSESEDSASGLTIEIYDGLHVPYPDKYFDIVLCNSVIEHVPVRHRRQFSSEIRRVGRCYSVQTPAAIFPIEPHFVMPFVHWLPRRLARIFVRFSPYRLLSGCNRTHLEAYFDEVNLLDLKEFWGYFPEANLIVERLFKFPKSYTMIYRSGHDKDV